MEESIRREFELTGQRPGSLAPHSLAYLGDVVYELVIRSVIVEKGDTSAKKMNLEAVGLARASAQAKLVLAIRDELTEEEADVFRRGRNANPGTKARHSSMSEYRLATGFEALIGWLYLTKQLERMERLLALATEMEGMN